jgi:hypothetical protein
VPPTTDFRNIGLDQAGQELHVATAPTAASDDGVRRELSTFHHAFDVNRYTWSLASIATQKVEDAHVKAVNGVEPGAARGGLQEDPSYVTILDPESAAIQNEVFGHEIHPNGELSKVTFTGEAQLDPSNWRTSPGPVSFTRTPEPAMQKCGEAQDRAANAKPSLTADGGLHDVPS